MKVENMTSSNGNQVPNQFIISDATIDLPEDQHKGRLFQSYSSNIAFIANHCDNTGNCCQVFLDAEKWDYSTTTGRYRNQFLGETTAETRKKIKSGEYKLVNLNN